MIHFMAWIILWAVSVAWWKFMMDSGYGFARFMEGATGQSLTLGRQIPVVDMTIIQAAREYFQAVYGGYGLSRFWLGVRFIAAIWSLVLPLALLTLWLTHAFHWALVVDILDFLMIIVIIGSTLIQWIHQGWWRHWKSTRDKRKYFLRSVARPFRGLAPFAHMLEAVDCKTPPSYLDGTQRWWGVRTISLMAVPALFALVYAVLFSSGVPAERLIASIGMLAFVFLLLPALYNAWIALFPWPATTASDTYYPLFVLRRDLLSEIQKAVNE